MLCDTVDIDDELFAAQDEGKLVVFVGAGVSVPPPSDLPLFRDLVIKIGGETVEIDDHVELDVILGRMEEIDKIAVHERCQEIIGNPASKPNPLHDSILSLFRRAEDVRIVTTNFDPHFSTCAQERNWRLKEYCAPALPVGSDFSGIVYLHGSIADPTGMILTDRDFGRAYMSDGWATVFLQRLFQQYTVIFIGYSHGDPMVTYLNLGLRNKNKRQFVLISADDPKWQRLGITPLLYKAGEEHGGHAKLEGALKAWADQTALRPTEIASRLQQILANPNLRSRSDEDFVLRHYNRQPTVGAFTDHALRFEWVIWLHSKGLIKPMLTENGAQSTDRQLSNWLGKMMARDKSGISFGILSDCGGHLNSHAARGIFMEIMRALATAPPDLAQKEWLRILLQQPSAIYFHLHSHMVGPLVKHGEWRLALDFFEFLVRPHVELGDIGGRDNRFGKIASQPVLTGEHFDLGETWRMISGASISLVDRRNEILEVLEKACLRLGEQCQLLGLDSHHRPGLVSSQALSLAKSDDDSIGSFVQLFAQHASGMAATGLLDEKRMSRWMESGNQVLIRCALLCMRQGRFSASTVLNILIKNNGFYPFAFFAVEELMPLLNKIYSHLSDPEKELFWNEVEKGPSEKWSKGSFDDKESERMRDYLITSVISMFPSDPAVIAAKERLRLRAPEAVADLKPWVERSGLFGEVREIHNVSPIAVDDLLKTNPADRLEYFLSFSEKRWDIPNREGLVEAIGAAALCDLTWGFQLLAAMVAQSHYENDIWIYLLWKLKWEDLSAEQRNWLIDNFDPSRGYSTDFLRPFTRLVMGNISFDGEQAIEPALLEKLLKLSLRLWDLVKSEESVLPESIAGHDWLFDAINSIAGTICEFWLQWTPYEHKKAPEKDRAWPAEIASYMDNIVIGTGRADQMGLAILGQHLAAVRYMAPVWTVQRLYPCMDFKAKGDWAFILWNSFAGYGRLSRELATELPPYLEKGFEKISKMKDSLAERFVGLVAAISISGLWDVKKAGWLNPFFKELTPKLRRQWLYQLARLIRDSLPEDKMRIWHAWLKEWWKLRTQGIPVRIGIEETESFYKLAMALGNIADEAVPFLEKCPPVTIQWSDIFIDTRHSTLFQDAPEALVSIVLWYLPQVQYLSSSPKDIDEFIIKLPPRASLKAKLEQMCDLLMRLNIPFSQERIDGIKQKFVQS